MRLSTAVAAALLACLLCLECEAGMDDWFKGMWGGGKGGGNKKGRGRRRPHGGYRPIYITAPPIFQHPHPPPLYKKPALPSYGFGPGFSGGFKSGGHDFSSFGSISPISSGYRGSFSAAPIKSAPSHASFSSSLHGPVIHETETTVHVDDNAFRNQLLHDVGKIPTGYDTIGHSTLGQDLQSGGGHGFILDTGSIHGSGLGHGFVEEQHGNAIESNVDTIYSSASSYGADGASHGKSQGFGPIKDDDLVIVETNKVASFGGGGIPNFGGRGVHTDGVANHIEIGGQPKGGRHVDLSPPPVYHAGSHVPAKSFGGHPVGAESREKGLSSEEILVTTDYQPPHASQLPMAEHGSSSVSYLDENIHIGSAPAPLYSIDDESSIGEISETGGRFKPSQQIPFPEQILQSHDQISGHTDVDTSYSAPAIVSSALPHREHQFSGEARQAHVSYDAPLDYTDPIIEIVFEDAPVSHATAPFEIDPSLYQPQSDDVEVYFIEVSDDETYDSVDDLDLSGALQGIQKEFPSGVPSELSQTLLKSGFLDNAQIEVLDLQSALDDYSLDRSVRTALQEAYGVESKTVETVVKPPEHDLELRLRRLRKDKDSTRADAELAKDLSKKKLRKGRYGGIVELNDEESSNYLPVTVDGNKIPIPDHPELNGRKIAGVYIYADDELENAASSVVLPPNHRKPRKVAASRRIDWSDTDWQPMPPYVSQKSLEIQTNSS